MERCIKESNLSRFEGKRRRRRRNRESRVDVANCGDFVCSGATARVTVNTHTYIHGDDEGDAHCIFAYFALHCTHFVGNYRTELHVASY